MQQKQNEKDTLQPKAPDAPPKDTSQQKPMVQQASENVHVAVEGAKEHVQSAVEGAQQKVEAARVPWYRAIKRGQFLVGVYALFLVLFGLLSWWVYYHPVFTLDVTITREFQESNAPWLYNIMYVVSYIGNNIYLSFGLVIVAAVIFWLLRLRLEALLILTVSAASGILNYVLKLAIGRPRPSASLVEIFQQAGGNSFPSGHVMSYVAFWGVLFSLAIILFKGNRWWRLVLLIIPALFIISVGPSRVYLGDHWASDVVGAYLISGTLVGLSLLLYLRLKAKGVLSTKKIGKTTVPE